MAKKLTYEQLEQRLRNLEKEVIDLKRGEPDENHHWLKFLSETAMELIEFPFEENLLYFAADKIKELVVKSVVGVSTFNKESKSICLERIVGLGKVANAVMKIFGRDPVGMLFKLDDEAVRGLKTSNLTEVPGGVFGLSPGVPKDVWSSLETLLGLGKAYSIGFSWKGNLFGNATLILPKGHTLKNQYAIETLVRQISVALLRRQAEEEVRETHDKLEELVRERTREMEETNEKLKLEIEERKQAEKALRESKDNLEKAQKIAHIGSWSRDLKSGQGQWSDEMYRTLGVTPGDPESPSHEFFLSRLHPHDREHTASVIEEATEKKGSFDIEFRTVPINGSERIVRSQGQVECDETGVPVRKVGTNQDITETRRLQDQLQQVQKMETMGTLAGGIAHDFNNLLMAIQGNASLMLLKKDPGHRDYPRLKNIEQYVQSGAELTKQLLGLARGGKYEVKPTDLNELIKKNSEMFGRTKKEIQIHLKYQEGLWTVEVDRGQIEQTLMNLYINAWQAMPGGGNLFIETENVELDRKSVMAYGVDPGKYVKISITDTGVGMDKKTLERIFDPFFTTKEMGKRSGLGLASAYGIIKNHGGIIDVRSKKGEETTFMIYLPASEKEVPREEELPEEVLEGEETILLVDDEEMIIDAGKEMLEEMGYTVLAAENGMEAIDTYREKDDEIDMVILDMIMPEMGGGETYDRLREADAEIKVLLSSGYSIDGEATEILERGCNGFIQKPFDMKEISHKIREVLDN